MLERGIIMIASGHPYYGRYAWNLAVSIKAEQPEMPILCCFNGGALAHLSQRQLAIFDYVKKIPDAPASPMAKLYAFSHSPFEKTLMLDTDMLWLNGNKPSTLFDELDGVDFTAITEGKESDPNTKYFFWADVDDIKANYNCITEIHQHRSEVVYYTRAGARVLERAKEICETHTLKSIKNFAHTVPDELGINIACAEMGIEPHLYKWQPSYWPQMNGGVTKWGKQLTSEHWLLSLGSNNTSGTIKRVYANIIAVACQKVGVQNSFPLEEKKHFLTTRQSM